jgi:hypothetical protein
MTPALYPATPRRILTSKSIHQLSNHQSYAHHSSSIPANLGIAKVACPSGTLQYLPTVRMCIQIDSLPHHILSKGKPDLAPSPSLPLPRLLFIIIIIIQGPAEQSGQFTLDPKFKIPIAIAIPIPIWTGTGTVSSCDCSLILAWGTTTTHPLNEH